MKEGRRTLDSRRQRRRKDANELLKHRVGHGLEGVVRAALLGEAGKRRRVAGLLDGVGVASRDLLERGDGVARERCDDRLNRRLDLRNEGLLGCGKETAEEGSNRVEDGGEDGVRKDADELRE